MTKQNRWHTPALTADLKQRFRTVFDRIAEGSVQRERDRILPHEAFGWLKEAGFGALRVPVDLGGLGAALRATSDIFNALSASASVWQIGAITG
ncbi:MAG: hypothetical protein ACK4YU_14235 [Paracoccus sp. (in: a-proteobacteria)]